MHGVCSNREKGVEFGAEVAICNAVMVGTREHAGPPPGAFRSLGHGVGGVRQSAVIALHVLLGTLINTIKLFEDVVFSNTRRIENW